MASDTTWLHVDAISDDVVAMTYGDEFQIDSLSEQMESRYYHVKVNAPLARLRHLAAAVPGSNGRGLDKFAGKIDITKAVPLAQRADVRNLRKRVKPIQTRTTNESDIVVRTR